MGARRARGETAPGGRGPGRGKARAPSAPPHRGDFLLWEPALPGPGRAGDRGGGGGGEATQGAGAGRGVWPGRSPAGEEVKQRVLLLLSARRHGRAGSTARRRRVLGARGLSTDARGGPLRCPRCPQAAAGAASMRARPNDLLPRSAPSAAWPPAPHRPLRREPSTSRSRRAAVTWRGPGRDVMRRREPGAARGGGVGPDPARPLAGVMAWAGRLRRLGGRLLRATGWAGPAWANALGVRTGRGCLVPAVMPRNPA